MTRLHPLAANGCSGVITGQHGEDNLNGGCDWVNHVLVSEFVKYYFLG